MMDYKSQQNAIKTYIESHLPAILTAGNLTDFDAYIDDFLDLDKYTKSRQLFYNFSYYNYDYLSNESQSNEFEFTVYLVFRNDKVAFVGGNERAINALFEIINEKMEPDSGTYKWGITTSTDYFPKNISNEFENDYNITEWLTGYSKEKDVTYVRGFLGRMLFGGDDGIKKVKVLSGGEKVRCMLSKLMISGANVLILNEPTDHLDMEAISALNNGMINFKGSLLFACRDHQIVETCANRIIEIMPNGTIIDKITTYDEYLASDEMARKRTIYKINEEDN